MLEQHEFNKMTPSQHLATAKSQSKTDLTTIGLALQHIASIPENSSESAEAIKLKEELLAQETKISDANAEKAKAEAERTAARNSAVERFGANLKDLGYDLKVEISETDEITITSSEFKDSDHRVRFLSFIRGKNAPTYGVCWQGFNKIRLKESKYSLLGFDESYSLDCIR
jgi:hypothetical protein